MGMAIARRMSQRHRVLLVDRDPARLKSCSESLQQEGAEVQCIPCDITDAKAVQAVGERARVLGPMTTVVNVVGLSPSMADFRTIFAVNLGGATYVADHLVPLLTPGGAAVFISSIAAHRVAPDEATLTLLDQPITAVALAALEEILGDQATPPNAYRLSKHGLNRLCARRAPALGARGIRINSVSPGIIATPMGALEFEKSPGKRALFAQTPLKREGTLTEIADAVDFLVSERAAFISGVDLLVDGGLLAAVRQPAD